MDKVIICKELELDKDTEFKIWNYKISEEWLKGVEVNQFIFIVSKEAEKQQVSIAEIIKIEEYSEQINITPLSENDKIYLVSEDYIMVPDVNIIQKHYDDNLKELRKFFAELINDLKNEMFLKRINPICDKRKENLLKMFWNNKIEEFYEKSDEFQKRWLKVYGNYEMDFIHIINLHMLYKTLNKLVEVNKTICNIDKLPLRYEYLNKIRMTISSINIRGNARYQMNEYLGISTTSDGKDIVLGKMSPLEFSLNIFSFWNLVKNLLTVSFIPILVGLLTSDKKPIIYCLLGIVYIVTLVLSDEKQTDKVIAFLNQVKWNKGEKIKYITLFYIGLLVVFVFIIFSIQVVYLPNIVEHIRSFSMYLIGDILLAYTALIAILFLVSLFFWIITFSTSTIFYIKRAKKFSIISSFCLKLLFWLFSDYCLFNILEISKYINALQNTWPRFIIFFLALIVSMLKIVQNISEFKEAIKK